MVRLRLVLAAIVSCLLGPCHGLYSSKGDVQLLTAKTFDSTIKASDQITVVEFFAPWCGHCKNLAPIYAKLATTLKGMVNVAAIDCDEDSNKSACGQYGIKGFPTIKVMRPKINKHGRKTFDAEDYNGQRTLKAMADHVTSIMPSNVQKLTSESLPEFLEKKNETAKVLLFTNKGATSSIYKALSTSFSKRISFGQIRDTQKAALETFGIDKLPTLLLLPGGHAPAVIHTGGMKLEELTSFVTSQTEGLFEAPEKEETTTDTKKAAAKPVELKIPTFKQLNTIEDFISSCTDSSAKSSLLVPKPLLTDLSFDTKAQELSFYEYSPEVGKHMEEAYGTLEKDVVYFNGRKSWLISAQDTPHTIAGLMEFVDKVKQGEAGKKVKFDKIVPKEEL